jgi:hypothetical protein
VDPEREPLEGVVEVDQAEIPFRADDSFFNPVKAYTFASGEINIL